MSEAKVIRLNKFKPREFQVPLFRAIEQEGFKRALCIWPRRAGKDISAFNLAIRACLRKVQTVFYVFPTYSSGRKILWDAITNDGYRVLDFCPQEIADRNEQMMRIRFRNGSVIQIIGSDNYDTSIVGTNAQLMIFSEYALQDPRAYQYSSPILRGNGGTAIFLSTPRGKNHLWEMYQIAQVSPEWWVSKLSVEDTQHIPIEEIQKELTEGIMSEDLIQQEYYCSFDMGVEGAYYTKYIDKMRLEDRIGMIPWEPGFPVHTAWDLGYNDPTCIIFFQIIGQTIRIIDCYSNNKQGLEHYAKIISQKEYTYGRHIGPHDIAVHDLSTGISRWKTLYDLGIKFVKPDETKIPHLIEDGIEAVRRTFPKLWIDEKKCAPLIKSLENYRQEFDPKRKVYNPKPLHDNHSHYCFTGDTDILTRNGMRQIKDVKQGDEVFTNKGWYTCTEASITQRNANLVEVKFTDGTIVKCTPEHLFLTTNGWKSARDLTQNSRIQSSLMNALAILMDLCIEYGKVRAILLNSDGDCTVMYGKLLLDQYLRIVTYTTKTLTPITTISGILNVFQKKSIDEFLNQITLDLEDWLELKRPNGTDQPKGENGIKITQIKLRIGKVRKDSIGHAPFVNQSLWALFVEMGVPRNSVTKIAKPLIIASVKKLDVKQDVWDIGVPDVGHFSLSNGAIVHNCDAMRYLCGSLPRLQTSTSAEELKARYQRAMYGDQVNLPSVFQEVKY